MWFRRQWHQRPPTNGGKGGKVRKGGGSGRQIKVK